MRQQFQLEHVAYGRPGKLQAIWQLDLQNACNIFR